MGLGTPELIICPKLEGKIREKLYRNNDRAEETKSENLKPLQYCIFNSVEKRHRKFKHNVWQYQ